MNKSHPLLNKLNLLILFLTFILSVSLWTNLSANGGFGVSGSFSNYHYRMVPGERIETPGVNVVFFNNYDIDIEVELSPNGPEGVEFLLENTIVEIPADSSFTVPIGIDVSETAVPGEYTLGLSARVIPQTVSGIQVVGAAELRTRLSIFGEAGDLTIESFDIMDNPFELNLRLFRVDGNTLAPVDESDDGRLERRYVPGLYRVFAYYEGVEVARRDITLENNDDLTEQIVANTVFIESFRVVPQFGDPDDLSTFSTARMRYTIQNIYEPPTGPLQDIRLGLRVWYRDSDIGLTEESVIPVLPQISFDGSFSYTPPSGWQAGLYEFQLFAYLGPFEDLEPDQIIELASSRLRELDVPSEAADEPEPDPVDDPEPEAEPDPEPDPDSDEEEPTDNTLLWIVIGSLTAGLIGFILWFLLGRKKDELTAPEIAEKRLKKAGYKANSPELNGLVEQVYDAMGPGTDFKGTKKGTDEYPRAVETFLESIDALKP